MMKFRYYMLILLFTAFFNGFAQQSSGIVSIKTDPKIDRIITEKKNYNKTLKTIKGYRIQLFYGSEKGVYKTRDKFESLFPDIPTKIIFSTPDWKIQAGNYLTKLDADRDLKQIKIDFPAAIVLRSDIDYKKK